MSEEHNLKQSEKVMGQLLPVIKDAKGRIVDGLHRTESNSAWRVEVRNEIQTDEDYWKARAHLNYSRRNAQEAHEEKISIINNLAKYYQDSKHLHVEGAQRGDGKPSAPKNEILDAVIKALDGAMSADYIRHNIDPIYTQEQKREVKPYLDPKNITPLEALANDEVTVKARYGNDFAERLRKQVLDESKLGPQERGALTRKRNEEKEKRERKREEKKRETEEKKKQDEIKRKKDIEEKAKTLKAQELLESDDDFLGKVTDELGKKQKQKSQQESAQLLKDLGIPSVRQQVEEFVKKTVNTPSKTQRPEVTREELIEHVQGILKRQKVQCKICGKNEIVWKCGHEFE